jgi:RND family efflux transporter MFP subunit
LRQGSLELPSGTRGNRNDEKKGRFVTFVAPPQPFKAFLVIGLLTLPGACGRGPAHTDRGVTVGVTTATKRPIGRDLTMSAELVPFQEIDVYAKEAGYVRELLVDYGTRVRKGQVMALLEIPELEAQVREDDAGLKNASDQVERAHHDLARVEAQREVFRLQYDRLNTVAQTRPGLVAQQEVDDAHGKDLAAEAQVESTRASLQGAESQKNSALARKERDQVLLDYSRITAPFAGVVTQRYANLGTLLQAGTNSSTQAMPLVRLSQDDLFRIVIPVPESYVRFIHVGDPVKVVVGSLAREFPGKVSRLASGVKEDTRTMHTEVDVANSDHVLLPGMYAEATLTLEHHDQALCVPLQALDHEGEGSRVYVVDRSDRIVARPVTLGVQTPSDAEIMSGLSEGEVVVVSDRASLKPGDRVEPHAVEVMQYRGDKEG